MGTWIGGAIFQTTFTRADAPLLVDWVDSGWGGPFALYCCMSPLSLLFTSWFDRDFVELASSYDETDD